MSTSRRSGSKWPLVALVVIIALLVGLFAGGHTGWMPGWVRSAFTSQSPQQHQVDSILGLIEKDYYRKPSAQQLANHSLEGAVAGLEDPYSHYFPPQQEQPFQQETNPQVTGIGVSVGASAKGLLINGVFPDGPASRAKLVPGDVITAVNGHSIAGVPIERASAQVTGAAGTKVTLTILRGTRRTTMTLVRQVVSEPVTSSTLLHYRGHRLGYIVLSQFSENAAAGVRTQLLKMLHQGAQGIILDLRDNPGGLVSQAVAAASLFIRSGTIVSTRGRSQPTTVYTALGGVLAPTLPLAVLVDRDTASAAEILTAALQERRDAQVVGTRTYGKGVFQESQGVTGGGILDITVGEFFTPDGTNLGGRGVAEGRDLTRGPGIKPDDYVYDNPADPGPAALAKAESVLAGRLARG